jgi:glutamate synthase (NADPH/NADH) small chain
VSAIAPATTRTLYAALPSERLERRMADYHPALTEAQALAEANRCLYCHDAPCVAACPTGIDIPEFIRKIATRNTRASAKTILDSNILGLSCARVCPVEVLCAGACVYNHLDRPPIEIGRLQRFATEFAYDRRIRFYKAGPPNGKKVACLGAGPASLACAAELAQLGYAVTILEGRALPGGLNTTGVAPYKLYAEDSLREVEYVLGIGGITLETGRWVTRDSFAELEAGYDAVFIGVGLGADSKLRVPGEDLWGVHGATALIELLKNKPAAELSWVGGVRHAIVVGGGNTSIDVVRELRKLGVARVTLVYRRGEEELPAYAHEVSSARKEGMEVVFHAQPLEVVGQAGVVTGLKVIRTRTAAAGPKGKSRLETVPGTEMTIPGDLVAVSIGQEMLEELLAGVSGIQLERGRVVVEEATGRTTNPKFYAGGDCANGGKEVVNAAAEGKRAARGIHAALFPAAPAPAPESGAAT